MVAFRGTNHLKGGSLSVWIFEDEEFQTWLEQRGPYESQLTSDTTHSRCISCSSDLNGVDYSKGPVCGYCLAYQFGLDSQERMLAEVASGLVRTLLHDDIDQVQQVFRQLLNDLNAVLG